MASFSVPTWLLVFAVCGPSASIWAQALNTTNDTNSCPQAKTWKDVDPQTCCGSFLEVHRAIIDCLPKAGANGAPCIGQCLLMNYRTHRMFSSMPMSVSSIISIGPKLTAHFDQCQSELYNFIVGNPFDGDFRRVVCDARLGRFFECMLKSWFEDCMGFDDENAKCVELQNFVKSSSCSVSSIFAQIGGE